MEKPSPATNRTYQLLASLLNKDSVFTSFFTFSQTKNKLISNRKKLQDKMMAIIALVGVI